MSRLSKMMGNFKNYQNFNKKSKIAIFDFLKSKCSGSASNSRGSVLEAVVCRRTKTVLTKDSHITPRWRAVWAHESARAERIKNNEPGTMSRLKRLVDSKAVERVWGTQRSHGTRPGPSVAAENSLIACFPSLNYIVEFVTFVDVVVHVNFMLSFCLNIIIKKPKRFYRLFI